MSSAPTRADSPVGQAPLDVRHEPEVGEEVVGKARIGVLTGRDHTDHVASLAQCRDDGRQLHDLRTRAERDEQLHERITSLR